MYISDLLRGLGRRWYVLLLGFALAAGGGYAVYDNVPVRHEANATMLLLPPDESVEVEGENPYLVLGGLGQALAVLTTRLGGPEVHDRLVADEDSAYGATGDTTSGAAFLSITTQAKTEREALALLDAVAGEASAQLAAMQDDLEVEETSVIGIMPVTSDVEATALTSTRMQLTIVALAAGVVLTVVSAAAVDGLSAARSRRRAAAEAPPQRERDPFEPLRASDVRNEEDAAGPRRRWPRAALASPGEADATRIDVDDDVVAARG